MTAAELWRGDMETCDGTRNHEVDRGNLSELPLVLCTYVDSSRGIDEVRNVWRTEDRNAVAMRRADLLQSR